MTRTLLACVALLPALSSPPAQAMRAPPPPLSELCARAELVVLAEPTTAEAAYAGDPLGSIHTTWDLHVERVVHGPESQDSLQVITLGGTVGGLTISVSEQPELRLDHRYLVLLMPRRDGGWSILGGPDGLIPVRRGPEGVGLDEADAIGMLGGCHGL